MKKNKTALVHGNFNIIHPGHLRILKFAKDCADKLIVAVNSDKYASGAAFVPEKLRIEALKSNNSGLLVRISKGMRRLQLQAQLYNTQVFI